MGALTESTKIFLRSKPNLFNRIRIFNRIESIVHFLCSKIYSANQIHYSKDVLDHQYQERFERRLLALLRTEQRSLGFSTFNYVFQDCVRRVRQLPAKEINDAGF